MTDLNSQASNPLVPHQTNSEQAPLYQLRGHRISLGLGLGIEIVGDLLVIVALFEPWLTVFEVPGLPVPTRSYSPWMVLQRGHSDALGVATGIFFLLTLGLALATLVQAFAPAVHVRFGASVIVGVLALVGLCMVGIALYLIPVGLALDYPYYHSEIVYGGGLAALGFVIALVSVTIFGVKWSGIA